MSVCPFCVYVSENGNKNGSTKEKYESLYEVSASLAKLGIIMGYFYLCDR